MRKIDKIRFYRSGEIVRDIGITYLFKILKEMEVQHGSDYGVILNSNFLEFMCNDYLALGEFIINVKVFENYKKGKYAEFRKRKLDEDLLNKATIEDFLTIIDNIDGLTKKEKEELKKGFDAKYMPYIRNSGKYGMNSRSEENFRHNLFELLRLVFELNGKEIGEQSIILEQYKPNGELCCICHSTYSTELDISHNKNSKVRINSKYNYMFMGAEGNNTFNNYGCNDSSICFVCEFLNLLFLLYFSLEQPLILAHTESLKNMLFFNEKINNFRKLYNSQGFYKKLSQYNMKSIRLYSIQSDPNKGLILRMEQLIRYEEIIKQINFYHITDKLLVPENIKRGLKYLVYSRNYDSIKDVILSNLICFDNEDGKRIINKYKTLLNVRCLIEVLKLEYEEIGGGNLGKDYKTFYSAGSTLGKKVKSEDKNKLGFKLVQLLKADNRDEIIKLLFHQFMANNIPVPVFFTKGILNVENPDELTYNIGVFLEGFFNGKEEEI